MYDEILENADFEDFLDSYYEAECALLNIETHTLEIDWQDLYRFSPDVADAAIVDTEAAIDELESALESLEPSVDANSILIQIRNYPVTDGGSLMDCPACGRTVNRVVNSRCPAADCDHDFCEPDGGQSSDATEQSEDSS